MDLVVIAGGQRLTLSGRRAEALALVALALLKRDWLEDADVFDVCVHATRGQMVVRAGDTAPPHKTKEAS